MFLRNRWYVAASPGEIGRELTRRWILGEPVLLYRTEAGRAVAFDDRCPHRHYALSQGKLVGDNVQCGYHGLSFDPDGACVDVPGQANIPPRLCAKTYPLAEKFRWLFIWMGDPALADESKIPDFHWNVEDGWEPVMGYLKFEANYQLVVDNLMDLTHETYVHQGTIGEASIPGGAARSWTEGTTVHFQREINDCAPPPLFKAMRGFTTNIDRWQRIAFEPPANIRIDAGAVPAGTNDESLGMRWMVLNALTPETPTSTHYFWSVSRHFNLGNDALSKTLKTQITRTFEEDRDVLEEQQRMIDLGTAPKPMLPINADQGVLATRKVIGGLLAEEAALA